MARRSDQAQVPATFELTILIPCLNEAPTIGSCVRDAVEGAVDAMAEGFEVLVVDNGSTDDSAMLAEAAGARVIHASPSGYGSALRAGIEAARGRFIIMGDGDGSYDFARLGPFVDDLRAGVDLVMGSRFGGRILPGAMPFLNRYIGNPILSFVGNLLFRVGIRDFHCGMRGFNRSAILSLGLHTPGMEFASEMVIRAKLAGLQIQQVPIVYSPDGRTRPPHLRPWRDGWRHLRFMLLFSPRWLFIYPGLSLAIFGGGASLALLVGPIEIGGVVLDVHTLIGSMTIMIAGTIMLTLGVFGRLYSSRAKLLPPSPGLERFVQVASLEVGLLFGLALFVFGVVLYIYGLILWGERGFGQIADIRHTLRIVIAGTASALLGLEAFFASFVFSLLTQSPDAGDV